MGILRVLKPGLRKRFSLRGESEDAFALGLSLGVASEYLLITGKDPELAREYGQPKHKAIKGTRQPMGLCHSFARNRHGGEIQRRL